VGKNNTGLVWNYLKNPAVKGRIFSEEPSQFDFFLDL